MYYSLVVSHEGRLQWFQLLCPTKFEIQIMGLGTSKENMLIVHYYGFTYSAAVRSYLRVCVCDPGRLHILPRHSTR